MQMDDGGAGFGGVHRGIGDFLRRTGRAST